MKVKDLENGILKRNTIAIAKSITLIENNDKKAKNLLKLVDKKIGKAHITGVTGVSGSGKSTLINCIIKELRKQNQTVGVLAVDPTSPYSGGALLGDRVRMLEHTSDEGVYVRSMATRGQLGGIAKETYNAAKILDAAGFDKIIIETIGVGQDEIDIVKIADTSMLVLTPGYGDDIQALKAGIMEIADIFIINKADYSGVEKTETIIKEFVHAAEKKVEVYKTTALSNTGIKELIQGMNNHLKYLKENKLLEEKKKERIKNELTNLINANIREIINKRIDLDSCTEQVYKKKKNIYSIAKKVMKDFTSRK